MTSSGRAAGRAPLINGSQHSAYGRPELQGHCSIKYSAPVRVSGERENNMRQRAAGTVDPRGGRLQDFATFTWNGLSAAM